MTRQLILIQNLGNLGTIKVYFMKNQKTTRKLSNATTRQSRLTMMIIFGAIWALYTKSKETTRRLLHAMTRQLKSMVKMKKPG